MQDNISEVYFARVSGSDDNSSIEDRICLLFNRIGFNDFVQKGDMVAIKTHFGEKGNSTHIQANHIKQLVIKIKESGGKPYLTETSVLYKSPRSNALDHILIAFDHGFTYEKVGAPIIMADGFLGNWEREVHIKGEFYEKVSIAGDLISANKIFIVSHATGHLLAGFGAALKNMGMGLSSRKGKLDQHSHTAPFVSKKKCNFCKLCIKWCPEDAIIEKDEKAFIIKERCIGCGECVAICKQDAVGFSWDATSEDLQKRMVEHALGVVRAKQGGVACINFLINMTKDCDCMPSKETFIDDIGILASFDPVAIDMATLDLTKKYNQENISKLSYPEYDPMIQLNHAEKLGMGSTHYTLIEI